MADMKISTLPAATALNGTEAIPAVQGGATVRLSPAQIAAYMQTSPYLGQVASGGEVPNTILTGYRSANYQGVLIAQDDIAILRIAVANWYLNSGNQQETGSGGTLTTRWAIEYPIGSGNWQPLLWSNARDVTIADKATSPLSDPLALAVAIPRGAAFRYRRHDEAAANLLAKNWGTSSAVQTVWSGNGNQAAFSTSANGTVDATTSNAAIGGGTNYGMPPTLVVGMTRRTSVIGIGDSRMAGSGDTIDGGQAQGNTMRALDAHYATLNAATPGDTLTSFFTAGGGALRRALAPYFSHVVSNYGINDINTGRTSAQVLGDYASFVGLFATQKVGFVTLEPYTSSTDNWASVVNQTVAMGAAKESYRVAVNIAARARTVPGQAFTFDIASAVESDLNSGRWAIVNGGAITGDGLHMSYLGTQYVRRSGAFGANALGR